MQTQMSLDNMAALVEGRHERPRDVLGAHEIKQDGRRALAVRALLPGSKQAWVVEPLESNAHPMRKLHPAGLYEAIVPLPNTNTKHQYRLRHLDGDGEVKTMHDPYAFPAMMTDYDLYLLGEGRHWEAYRRMGAHERTVDDVKGAAHGRDHLPARPWV